MFSINFMLIRLTIGELSVNDVAPYYALTANVVGDFTRLAKLPTNEHFFSFFALQARIGSLIFTPSSRHGSGEMAELG